MRRLPVVIGGAFGIKQLHQCIQSLADAGNMHLIADPIETSSQAGDFRNGMCFQPRRGSVSKRLTRSSGDKESGQHNECSAYGTLVFNFIANGGGR